MRRKGFTLIELMVVILIVAILAAVAIPILTARIDAAKWSEGKAMMGTIATAIRAYYAEHGLGTPHRRHFLAQELRNLALWHRTLAGRIFPALILLILRPQIILLAVH